MKKWRNISKKVALLSIFALMMLNLTACGKKNVSEEDYKLTLRLSGVSIK